MKTVKTWMSVLRLIQELEIQFMTAIPMQLVQTQDRIHKRVNLRETLILDGRKHRAIFFIENEKKWWIDGYRRKFHMCL